MNNKQYIKDANKTATHDFEGISKRLSLPDTMQLLHAVMGLNTEAGEALDTMKRHIFYGKEIDKVNLKEELGDLFWYVALMANVLDLSFEEIQEANIAKLKARFGDKFSEEGAINRDLNKEREILEQ